MAQEIQVAQQRNNPKSEGKRKRSRNRNRRRKNRNVEKLEVGNNKAQQNKKLEDGFNYTLVVAGVPTP